MTKEINITHVDTQQTDEKIGGDEKKKVKTELVHEKLFKEYNIDPNRKNATTTIPIPNEWIPDIVKLNIESVDVKIAFINHNAKMKNFILSFNDEDSVKQFDKEFSANLFNTLNSYIETRGANVRKYQRNIVFTKNDEGLKITIEY